MGNRMQLLRTGVGGDGVQQDRLMRARVSSVVPADVLITVTEPNGMMTPTTEPVKACGRASASLVFDDELGKKVASICEILHARARALRVTGCSQSKVCEDLAELFRSVDRLVENCTSTCECINKQKQKGVRKRIVEARKLIDDCDDIPRKNDSLQEESNSPRNRSGPSPPSEDDIYIKMMTQFYLRNGDVSSKEVLTPGQAVRIAEEMAKKATAVKDFVLPEEYGEWVRGVRKKLDMRLASSSKITGEWDEALRNVQWLLHSVLWV